MIGTIFRQNANPRQPPFSSSYCSCLRLVAFSAKMPIPSPVQFPAINSSFFFLFCHQRGRKQGRQGDGWMMKPAGFFLLPKRRPLVASPATTVWPLPTTSTISHNNLFLFELLLLIRLHHLALINCLSFIYRFLLVSCDNKNHHGTTFYLDSPGWFVRG